MLREEGKQLPLTPLHSLALAVAVCSFFYFCPDQGILAGFILFFSSRVALTSK